MRWNKLALMLVLMTGTGSAAVADQVRLKAGSTIRGTIANRSELLRSPVSVTTIEVRLEMPGTDAASVQSLSFARSEVDFVVLEDGRMETVIPLSTIALVSPRRRPLQRLWLSITMSRSDYAMADLNGLVDDLNSRPTTVSPMSPVSAGFGGGMELGVDLPNGLTAGLGWDRIRATTRGADQFGDVTLSVSAFLLRAFGSYGIARSNLGSARLGLSLGAVLPSAVINHDSPNPGDVRDRVVGVAPAGELYVGGERHLHRLLGVSLDAGYRRAISREVPIAALGLRDLDYSGWFLRAGLQLSGLN